jgi:hypothetical protein
MMAPQEEEEEKDEGSNLLDVIIDKQNEILVEEEDDKDDENGAPAEPYFPFEQTQSTQEEQKVNNQQHPDPTGWFVLDIGHAAFKQGGKQFQKMMECSPIKTSKCDQITVASSVIKPLPWGFFWVQ